MSTPTTVRTREATAPARPRHQPAPAPTRRHLRPVPEQAPATERAARRRLRPQVALTMAILAFFVILFGVALLQTVLVQGQIHLDGLRADAAEREAEVQIARNGVAASSSPAAMIEAAERLGLEPVGQRFVTSTATVEPPTP